MLDGTQAWDLFGLTLSETGMNFEHFKVFIAGVFLKAQIDLAPIKALAD